MKTENWENSPEWLKYVKVNTDPYGKAAVDVARELMIRLDKIDIKSLHKGYYPDLNTPHGLICKVNNDIKAGGITGFQANAILYIVKKIHPKGLEFYEIY